MTLTRRPPPADSVGRRRGRQLTRLAVAAATLLVVVYVFFVLTPVGQRLDTEGYLGRYAADEADRLLLARILHTIDIAMLVAMLAVVVGVGLVRRRWRMAVVGASSFAVAVLASQLLKAVLPRPHLITEFDEVMTGKRFDTYPSGHATIATGFVLALVLVSSQRYRPVVAVLGVLWSSILAAGTVTAGWHRPSDAVGGILLAGAVTAAGAAHLAGREGEQVPVPRTARLVPLAMVLVLVLLVSGIVLNQVDARIEDVPVMIPLWVYPAGQTVIDLAAVGVVGAFAWLQRDLRYGARHTETD